MLMHLMTFDETFDDNLFLLLLLCTRLNILESVYLLYSRVINKEQ